MDPENTKMRRSFLSRMSIYTWERFNPLSMGLVSVVLGLSAWSLVNPGQLGAQSLQPLQLLLGAGTSSLALFLFLFRLRLFDEHKDALHDARYHPERPVSRNLVSLQELRLVLVVVLVVEVLLAVRSPLSFWWWLVGFGYSLILFKELFISDWLRPRFSLYIASHELLLLPFIWYLYSVSQPLLSREVLFAQPLVSYALFWIATLFSLEVVRKYRSPEKESSGKDTYSSVYGLYRGALLLMFVLAASFVGLAWSLPSLAVVVPGVIGWLVVGLCVAWFLLQPTRLRNKAVFVSVALYTLCLHLISITILGLA